MLSSRDARRRWFGLFFLILAFGVLVWGQTLLKDYLFKHKALFIIYWLSCFFFTGLAMIMALIDSMIMRQRARENQKHLFKSLLHDATHTNNQENPDQNELPGPQ